MRIWIAIGFSLLFTDKICQIDTGRIWQKKSMPAQTANIPLNAAKLIKSYPGFISAFVNNQIVFKNHSKLIWDDSIKNKSYKDQLEKPDLKDMFLQRYVKGPMKANPAKMSDPGRIRNEQFFMKLYGASEKAAEKNQVTITWCPKLVGQKISITKVNGVNKKLIQISNELDKHPEWKNYLSDIGGTFAWRKINGTKRQSTHSFGMTMDINVKYSDYWQWACHCTDETAVVKYRSKIPQGIIDIFEKYGFIWGGKWYHFDTMHFEYRPELLTGNNSAEKVSISDKE